jgi:hypothetical protein
MSLRFEAAIEGRLSDYVESRVAIARGGMMAAAGFAGREVVSRLRADVSGAGLGQRVANAWRANVYPSRGRASLEPAVYVFTKAPGIVAAFANGATIRPVKGGVFLWIATENVPRIGRGAKRMTPSEVENRFNQDFDIVPASTRPGVFYAVLRLISARSGRGFRQASKARRAQGRDVQRVVMFVLVRQVRLRKRLDVDAIAAEAARTWPEIVARSLTTAFRNAGD